MTGFEPATPRWRVLCQFCVNGQRKRGHPIARLARKEWSGRPDSNRGLPAPKAGALPGCATPRQEGDYPTRAQRHPIRGRACDRLGLYGTLKHSFTACRIPPGEGGEFRNLLALICVSPPQIVTSTSVRKLLIITQTQESAVQRGSTVATLGWLALGVYLGPFLSCLAIHRCQRRPA